MDGVTNSHWCFTVLGKNSQVSSKIVRDETRRVGVGVGSSGRRPSVVSSFGRLRVDGPGQSFPVDLKSTGHPLLCQDRTFPHRRLRSPSD